jgi:hypothetical protein
MISDEQLILWNKRGLIPGPSEDETSFLERIAIIEAKYAQIQNSAINPEHWVDTQKKLKDLFDIAPDWIVAFYSDSQLPFWQGAATWIENKIPEIQLKKAFAKGVYLKIYQRDEVLAHEATHACRMAFEEPRFEEIFAYATSKNALRRFFGPLFRTSKESYLFMFCLLFSLSAQIAQMFLEDNPILLAVSISPIFLLITGLVRLCLSHLTLHRCLKNLGSIQALAIAYRLTDKEIAQFARQSPQKCKKTMQENKEISLRWRCLSLILKPD